MRKIISLEQYYKEKLVQEVMAIKVKLHENVERLEKKNRNLELEVEALSAENAVLKAIIKQYEKEAK